MTTHDSADASAAGQGGLTLAYLGDVNSIHLRRWAGWFATRGHRTIVLVPDDAAVQPGLHSGISVARYEPYDRSRLWPVGAMRTRRSLTRILDEIRADVLHAHYLTTYGWTARLSGFRPYAITVWGSDVLITLPESRRARLYARIALGAASLVTVDSAGLLAATVAAGARPERVREIQFGVDAADFRAGPDPHALRARLGLEGRRVVFAPRTIAPLYRHGVLVEALAGLPPDVVVVMTRHLAWPAEVDRLDALARRRGIADRLRILPPVDRSEMVDLYRLAEAVVTIPAQDGTPVSLLEALAVGRPVVASDIAANREWLHEVDPELLVPIDDVGATRTAIQRALERNTTESDVAATKGRALVDQRADHDRNMAVVEELYRTIVRQARGGSG